MQHTNDIYHFQVNQHPANGDAPQLLAETLTEFDARRLAEGRGPTLGPDGIEIVRVTGPEWQGPEFVSFKTIDHGHAENGKVVWLHGQRKRGRKSA